MKYFFFSVLLSLSSAFSYELRASDDEFLREQLKKKSNIITLTSKTYYLNSKLNIPPGKIINGNGSKFIFTKIVANEWQMTINENSVLSNIEVSSNMEKSLFDFQTNGSPLYSIFNFNYVKGFQVLWLAGDNIKLNNVKILDSYIGISGNSDKVHLNKVLVKGAHAPILFYMSSHIKIINSTFYGGDFACLGLPSCHDIFVEKCNLFNPKSTGVNPGGATDTGLNAKRIVIKNNYVIAGDCINLENGAEQAEIESNELYCAPILNQYINNNAIGVQTHDPKANGKINSIRIENNRIYSYKNILFATGINVGNIIGNSVNNIVIQNNYIEGANEGMRLHSLPQYPFKQCTIRNNTLKVHAFGIRLANVTQGEIRNNNLSSYNSTWNNNLIGIQLNKVNNLSIANNTTKGFDKHYYQYSECSQVNITNPTFNDQFLARKGQLLYTEKEISVPVKIIYNLKK